MATQDQIEQRQAAGHFVRRQRNDREDHSGRSAEQVKRLREQAAKAATVCADCFAPLAAHGSVTLVRRWIELVPAHRGFVGTIPPRDRYEFCPICLPCWLHDLPR